VVEARVFLHDHALHRDHVGVHEGADAAAEIREIGR
jgi:hypothetical protein